MKTKVYHLLVLCLLFFVGDKIRGQAPAWEWAKNGAGMSGEKGRNLAIDANGNSYVIGSFESPTLTFGNYTLINTDSTSFKDDMFIVKYDPSGNVLWAKSAGGTFIDRGESIGIDVYNNIYVTGEFHSLTITFDTITLTNSSSDSTMPEFFIAKYDFSGNVQWAKSAGGIGKKWGYDITVDTIGNSYVTGIFFDGNPSFGGTTLINSDTSGNASDIFIVKFDSMANVIWARSAGGIGSDYAYEITVDNFGNSYLTGSFTNSAFVFGSTTLPYISNYDFFMAKYDASGNPVWAKGAIGNDVEYGLSIAVDTNGNLFLAGCFSGDSITLGNTTLLNSTVATFGNIFLIKCDTAGNLIWAKSEGGNLDDFARSLKLDTKGNIYLAGDFTSDSITMGGTTLFNSDLFNNSTEIFISKYDNQGNIIWVKGIHGNDNDVASEIEVDANENIFLTGVFWSYTLSFDSLNLTRTNVLYSHDMFTAKLGSINTGIEPMTSNNNFSIYPNPATNQLYVTQTKPITKNTTLTIIDMQGRVVKKHPPLPWRGGRG